MKAFVQYKTDGTLWRAGNTVLGLCAAWNHATNPAAPMTAEEHKKASAYARAIKNRMCRLGLKYGVHFKESSYTSALFPIRNI